MQRVGDTDEASEALAAERREFGIATWQAPLIFHPPLPGAPDVETHGDPDAPSLETLIAQERPPVSTHLTEGALQEHAKHQEPQPQPETD